MEAELHESRRRMLALLKPLSDEDLVRQHTPLLSPIVWDVAHIAVYEELWLLRRLHGRAPLRPGIEVYYDAVAQPRSGRAALPLLTPDEALAYAAEVRENVLETLPGNGDHFFYRMVVQHEHQHVETMLQALEHAGLPHEFGGPGPCGSSGERLVEQGVHVIGSDSPWSYDNERDLHLVELPGFWIDRRPVTNAELGTAGPSDAPAQNVSWHTATAYADSVGKRLPTELEWEAAARAGALESVGEVWEWTASEFDPYPGFRAYPYADYSETYFGRGYRVLRGSSWATHPRVARVTFRNWDLPDRDHIFAGVRLARDAD